MCRLPAVVVEFACVARVLQNLSYMQCATCTHWYYTNTARQTLSSLWAGARSGKYKKGQEKEMLGAIFICVCSIIFSSLHPLSLLVLWFFSFPPRLMFYMYVRSMSRLLWLLASFPFPKFFICIFCLSLSSPCHWLFFSLIFGVVVPLLQTTNDWLGEKFKCTLSAFSTYTDLPPQALSFHRTAFSLYIPFISSKYIM